MRRAVLLVVLAMVTVGALSGQEPAQTPSATKSKVTAPVPLFIPEPTIPAHLKTPVPLAPGVNVLVRCKVNSKGRTRDVRVLKTGNEELNKAAVNAVRDYRFEPALQDGQPVEIEIEIYVNFATFLPPILKPSTPRGP